MYAALWRIIPGSTWFRVLVTVLAAVATVTALCLFVFPAIAAALAPSDVGIGAG